MNNDENWCFTYKHKLPQQIPFTMTLLCKPAAILIFATLCLDYIISLELTELQVPTHALLGTRVVMLCRWALGPGDVLYSIKWYKNGREFFRYVPRDPEPWRKFLLPGVDVEEFNTSGSNLTLAPAAVTTSGRYHCEVSGERPRFQTVSKYADLLVIVLPSLGPSILGVKPHYRVGDHVNVSCTSGQARSAVKLAWYINGEPATPSVESQPVVEKGGVTTSTGIEFTVEKRLVGELKLKCLATIASIYWQSIEECAVVSGGTLADAISRVSTVSVYPVIAKSGTDGIRYQYFLVVRVLFIVLIIFVF